MRKRSVVPIAAVLLCSATSMALAATASLTVSTSARVFPHPGPSFETASNNQQLEDPGPGDLIMQTASKAGGPGGSNGGTSSLAVGLGFFFGNVTAGVNFTGVEGGGIFPGEVTSASGFAYGTYSDEVTVSHPGLAGEQGTLSATMVVSGALATSGNDRGSASWGLEKLINTTLERTHGFLNQSRSGDQVTTSGDNTGGDMLRIEAPFIFGEPFPVQGIFSLSAGVGTTYRVGCCPFDSRFVEAQSLFGNSAEWQGIDQILGPDGSVLEGFEVMSASGTDWSLPARGAAPPQPPGPGAQVIPVPAALPLLLSALGLIGAFGHRRPPARGTSAG